MGKDTFGGKYLGMLNILNVIREWAYCYIPDVLRVSADAAVSCFIPADSRRSRLWSRVYY